MWEGLLEVVSMIVVFLTVPRRPCVRRDIRLGFVWEDLWVRRILRSGELGCCGFGFGLGSGDMR